MSGNVVKQRDSSIECLRILCIFLILLYHFDFYTQNELNLIIYRFIGIFGQVAVSAFILITGYYMIDKAPKIRRLVSLVVEVWTYSIIISVIMAYLGETEVDIDWAWVTLMPLTSSSWWFITYYLVLVLISPALNAISRTMSRNQQAILLGISFVILSAIPTLVGFNLFVNQLFSFIFLYLLGGFFRKHPSALTESFRLNGALLLAFLTITMIFVIVCVKMFIDLPPTTEMREWRLALYIVTITAVAAGALLLKKPLFLLAELIVLSLIGMCLQLPELGLSWIENICKHYTVLATCLSVSLFLTFKNLEMRYHPFINKVAASVFASYLITTHVLFKPYLYNEIIQWTPWADSVFFVAYYLGVTVATLAVTVAIEQIRILIMKGLSVWTEPLYARVTGRLKKGYPGLEEYFNI